MRHPPGNQNPSDSPRQPQAFLGRGLPHLVVDQNVPGSEGPWPGPPFPPLVVRAWESAPPSTPPTPRPGPGPGAELSELALAFQGGTAVRALSGVPNWGSWSPFPVCTGLCWWRAGVAVHKGWAGAGWVLLSPPPSRYMGAGPAWITPTQVPLWECASGDPASPRTPHFASAFLGTPPYPSCPRLRLSSEGLRAVG